MLSCNPPDLCFLVTFLMTTLKSNLKKTKQSGQLTNLEAVQHLDKSKNVFIDTSITALCDWFLVMKRSRLKKITYCTYTGSNFSPLITFFNDQIHFIPSTIAGPSPGLFVFFVCFLIGCHEAPTTKLVGRLWEKPYHCIPLDSDRHHGLYKNMI